MPSLFDDVRYSIRAFGKSPGFTITAIAALGIGIGATTAVFSIVNTVLLRPIPFPDPDSLLVLATVDPSQGSGSGADETVSPARFVHLRAQSDVLHDVAAIVSGMTNYSGGGNVEPLTTMRVSAETFSCFGIAVRRGRGFTAGEDRPGGPAVVVLGEGLWKRRFAGDPQIVGRTIDLGGEPYTVIGVAAETAGLREFGGVPDLFLPFQADPNTHDMGQYFTAVARLRPGVGMEQAAARLEASSQDYRARFPGDLGPKEHFTARPFRESLVGDVRPLLLILLAAVSLVLLIACANVANLLLARAAARRREIAIRTALGASRARTVRQLLVESVLLSLAGGVLGLWLGYAGIRALLAVNTADLPMVGKDGAAVTLDWHILAFVLAVSLATGILFGLFPALAGSRADLHSILKEAGRGGSGLRRNKARAALVMSEVSLAVVLLVGAALLIRTFQEAYSANRGFATKDVVTMRTLLSGPKYASTRGTATVIREGLERLRALPGVEAAAATCCVPLLGNYDLNIEIAGRPLAAGQTMQAGWSTVSPGFFETFRVPVKRGRTFTDRDDGSSQPVVLINEMLARRYWKDRDPLQERLIIGRGLMKEFQGEPPRQIVGIVGDVRDEILDERARPMVYVPQAQLTDAANAFFMVRQAPLAWVVRAQAGRRGMTSAIRDCLRQATHLPVSDIHSMEEVVWLSTGRQRFSMLLMAAFGTSALLLAAVGIYGLMAYTVEQRTQEIGIRLALGANAGQVRNMVVRQGMALAVAGLAAGLAAAWGIARLFESLLFGVKAHDPAVFLLAPAILCIAGLAAVWIPAARASRVNPIDSLRYE